MVCRSLGHLIGSDFFKPSSIQSNEERLEVSQFSMVILEREASEQIGEGSNMRIVYGGHFWQFGSIASLAAETSSILAQTWPQKRSQSA